MRAAPTHAHHYAGIYSIDAQRGQPLLHCSIALCVNRSRLNYSQQRQGLLAAGVDVGAVDATAQAQRRRWECWWRRAVSE